MQQREGCPDAPWGPGAPAEQGFAPQCWDQAVGHPWVHAAMRGSHMGRSGPQPRAALQQMGADFTPSMWSAHTLRCPCKWQWLELPPSTPCCPVSSRLKLTQEANT